MPKLFIQNKMISLYNTRELKSLRLFKNSKNLELLFQEKNACGLIVSCASLHSKERIQTQEQFLEKNLKITKIPNKLVQFLCLKDTLAPLNNLLHGALYLIQDVKEDASFLLNNEKLNNILNYKAFKIRFLLWNQNLYRPKEFLRFKLIKTKPIIKIIQVLQYNRKLEQNL